VCCFVVFVVERKDADTIIMNRSIALESFLPPDDSTIDLLLTEEKGRSWNAGAWIIRNSAWSLNFLDTWWNMTSFVKPKGLSTSGDNDALKHYLTEQYDALFGSTNPKIYQVPRCTFNSVAPFLSQQQQQQMSWGEIKTHFGPNSHRHYHRGDFVAHVAGINNKVKGVLEVLKDAQ
jgi:galactosyl transferase GMA12/MNN10 family